MPIDLIIVLIKIFKDLIEISQKEHPDHPLITEGDIRILTQLLTETIIQNNKIREKEILS